MLMLYYLTIVSRLHKKKILKRYVNVALLIERRLFLIFLLSVREPHEGKLQVELAQLRHMSSRLIRGWTHLERQKGGVGLRGPGETQLETDRRLLRERMINIRKRLEKVERQRHQGRRARTS